MAAARDKELQNELFGSDSDDDDDAPARPPSAATGEEPVDGEEADGDDVGEAELFGSDDSDAEAAPGSIVSAPSAPSAPPLHYELPLLPRPEVGSELYTMRLPNILSIEPRAFDPLTFEDADEEADKIMGKTDNIIRWRETEEGVRQSNARMVTWSDGSMTLHVGDEVLTAAPQKVEGGNQLFTRHKGSNLECHGLVRKKLVLQPASIKSSTHRALTKRIAKNHVKGSRMQMHTTTEVRCLPRRPGLWCRRRRGVRVRVRARVQMRCTHPVLPLRLSPLSRSAPFLITPPLPHTPVPPPSPTPSLHLARTPRRRSSRTRRRGSRRTVCRRGRMRAAVRTTTAARS